MNELIHWGFSKRIYPKQFGMLNDKLILMRQKCKRGFAHTLFAHAACSITFVFFLSVSHRHV